MKWQTAAALTVAGAVWIARRQAQAAPDDAIDDYEEFDQLPTTWESITVNIDPTTYIPAFVDDSTAQRNVRAFLDMISFSEGTNGPNGYTTAFGGGRLESLADHPRTLATFVDKKGRVAKTTAAGRYQFLSRTWDEMAAKLGLTDFGPASQDAAAIELIRQRGALGDVQAGRVEQAIAKCAKTWASMPGAGYNQKERKLSSLLAQYAAAGGSFA